MKLIPRIKGRVLSGRFYPHDESLYTLWMNTLDDKECELVIKEWKKQRSLDQNAYYWGVVVKIIAEEKGSDEETVHEILSSKFLKVHRTLDGKHYVSIRSTTSLSTSEFIEYVEKCKMFASIELGIYIPDAEKITI